MLLQLGLNIALTPVSFKVDMGSVTQGPALPLTTFSREQLKNMLIQRGGKYLVIVQYTRKHNFHFEWVFNGADIDHAPIVWARDMGPQQNRELLQYFKDRQVVHVRVFWDSKGFPHYYDRQSMPASV